MSVCPLSVTVLFTAPASVCRAAAVSGEGSDEGVAAAFGLAVLGMRRIRYFCALGFVVIELFRFFQGVKHGQMAVF